MPTSTGHALTTDRQRRRVAYGIGLAALASLPWDRRVQERAVVVVIVLAAVAGLARATQANSLDRLLAWNDRLYQRYLDPKDQAGSSLPTPATAE